MSGQRSAFCSLLFSFFFCLLAFSVPVPRHFLYFLYFFFILLYFLGVLCTLLHPCWNVPLLFCFSFFSRQRHETKSY